MKYSNRIKMKLLKLSNLNVGKILAVIFFLTSLVIFQNCSRVSSDDKNDNNNKFANEKTEAILITPSGGLYLALPKVFSQTIEKDLKSRNKYFQPTNTMSEGPHSAKVLSVNYLYSQVSIPVQDVTVTIDTDNSAGDKSVESDNNNLLITCPLSKTLSQDLQNIMKNPKICRTTILDDLIACTVLRIPDVTQFLISKDNKPVALIPNDCNTSVYTKFCESETDNLMSQLNEQIYQEVFQLKDNYRTLFTADNNSTPQLQPECRILEAEPL